MRVFVVGKTHLILQLSDLRDQFVSIHLRHIDLAEKNIQVSIFDDTQRLGCAVGRENDGAVAFQGSSA